MKRRLLYAALGALFLGLLLYALRGPDISNKLKRIILPELELATGKMFVAEKIYINLLPLFIEMKGVKGLDESGRGQISAARVKGYVSLSGILRKEIVIRRLVIRQPEVSGTTEFFEEIRENVKRYASAEQKTPVKVLVKSLEVGGGSLSLADKNSQVSLNNLNAEVLLSDTPRFRISSGQVKVVKQGLAELVGVLDSSFTVKDKTIEIENIRLLSQNSEINTSGSVNTETWRGELSTEMRLFVESVKKVFGLKSRGNGSVSARGLIRMEDLTQGVGDLFVDLKVGGDLYLETLMELLKVKENLKGYLKFDGELKGYLKDIIGSAKARIEEGNLFGVDVDRISCDVDYRGGVMRFSNGYGQLYNGSALAEAQIRLPVVDYYSFKATVTDVSSKAVFRLIDWDPHIPEGRVSGVIASSGSDFSPSGNFSYQNTTEGKDVLERIREIRGEFTTSNNVMTFSNMAIATGKSTVSVGGSVDFTRNKLTFEGRGSTTDMTDLTSPYFTALSGPGNFNARVSGELKDPVIDLEFATKKAEFTPASIGISGVSRNRVVNLDGIEGAVTYRKNLLSIRRFIARSPLGELTTRGEVSFPRASALFEIQDPEYNLSASASSDNLQRLSDLLKKGPPLTGKVNADIRVSGRPRDIAVSGDFHGSDLSLDHWLSADQAGGKLSYRKGEFFLEPLYVKSGASDVTIRGRVSWDKGFSLEAESSKINIADIMKKSGKETQISKFLATLSLTNIRMRGEGTVEDPSVTLSAAMSGGAYKGRSVGKGEIRGSLKGRQLDFSAQFLDGKVSLTGGVALAEPFPWSGKIELQQARYDFLVAGVLQDVPDDLLLNLKGTISAQGDRQHVNALATMDKVHLFIYGNGFTNSSPVTARMNDGLLSLGRMSLKSDATEFNLGGSVSLGKRYDLTLEGSSSLEPLRALAKNIDVLKGRSSYVISLSGPWDKPELNGSLDVVEGTLGIKNIPYRLTSLSAYIYFDQDRLVIQRASGKLSGGEVTVLGSASLQGLSIKRFSVESRLKGITASPSKDFWVNLDGDIYYRGNLESQTVSGDITVKRAKYTERIDWRSWLLAARPKGRTKKEYTRIDETSLNVKVVAPNLVIDNNLARAALNVDILLKGTLGQPIPYGKVETKEGIVYFRSNEFTISKARIDFTNPNRIYPYLDVIAETKVQNYTIRLIVNGFPDGFNASLTSSPYLNESDIVSLLTVGYVTTSQKGAPGGIGTSEATAFLAGKLEGAMDDRLKTVIGIDRIQVEPSVSRKTATVTPRVTVAKKVGERLYLTYGTTVVTGGTGAEQLWKIEYMLDKNISLVGTRDELGGIGGDIRYRFKFK